MAKRNSIKHMLCQTLCRYFTYMMLFLPSYEMYIVPNNYCRKKAEKDQRICQKSGLTLIYTLSESKHFLIYQMAFIFDPKVNEFAIPTSLQFSKRIKTSQQQLSLSFCSQKKTSSDKCLYGGLNVLILTWAYT